MPGGSTPRKARGPNRRNQVPLSEQTVNIVLPVLQPLETDANQYSNALPTNQGLVANERSPRLGKLHEEIDGPLIRRVTRISLTQKTAPPMQKMQPRHTLIPTIKRRLAIKLAMLSNLPLLRDNSIQHSLAA